MRSRKHRSYRCSARRVVVPACVLQALALLCSPMVFLERVVSGKLMRLFGLDHCISWKNRQAAKRLLVSVGETFVLLEGRAFY